jgi:large subunit ribosomal protein L3
MANGLLGKKLGMTQVYDEAGRLTPVTVVEAGPCRVVQIRTKDQHGYEAVQLSFHEVPNRKLTKAELGHLKVSNIPSSRKLREFKKGSEVQVGQALKADLFQKGDWVDVEGISKGKGYQGVVKRHHYKGGPETHGSMFHRAPGSIGSSSFPSRVWKNKALPGHMGSERVTIQRLRIVEVRPDENLLFVSGAVPGARGDLVTVRKSKKS